MKLAVEFASVVYREGPEAVRRLARGIEEIGYDQLDLFDHVVMGHATESRPAGPYAANIPILEALTTLSFVAACTERIGLGTEVLVLPQRDPVLVAKQVGTLDTLSGGRVRLGVGVGWQESEYEALGHDFHTRGARMNEAIVLLREAWQEDPLTFESEHYKLDAMGMEPKPPQGGALPIWIGGHAPASLRRAGRLGDGWLAVRVEDETDGKRAIETVRRHAEEAGRDADRLGFQSQIAPPPRPGEAGDRDFYGNLDQMTARVATLKSAGFGWVAVNATSAFLAGSRSVDALIDALARLHDRLRSEFGPSSGEADRGG